MDYQQGQGRGIGQRGQSRHEGQPWHQWQKHSGTIREQGPVSVQGNGGIRQSGQPQTQRPELGLYGGIFLVKQKVTDP